MKFLSVCDVPVPQTTGGAGRVACELAEAFMKMGAEVEFLTRFTGKASPSGDKVTYFLPPGKAFPGHYREIFLKTVKSLSTQTSYTFLNLFLLSYRSHPFPPSLSFKTITLPGRNNSK